MGKSRLEIRVANSSDHLHYYYFFCILFIYFLFTGIVQTTYRSKHTNITKFTTTTLITKKKKKENRINK